MANKLFTVSNDESKKVLMFGNKVLVVGSTEITDLTGCTWVGNDTIAYSSSFGTYNINANVNDISVEAGDTLTSLYMEAADIKSFVEYGLRFGGGTGGKFNGAIFTDCLYESANTSALTKTSSGTGLYAFYSLTFTGGTNATNATLIAWLKANGTLTKN